MLWRQSDMELLSSKIKYSASRMGAVEINFTLPNNFDAELYFENCYGVITADDNNVETVDIEVLSPESFRSEIREIIEKQHTIYHYVRKPSLPI